MIVEYIRYQLTTHTGAQLVAAYGAAAAHLQAAPECLGYDLAVCEEDPAAYVLRILWTSGPAHLEGFRRGPHFPPFLALVRPFIDEIAEMRHYAPSAVHWMR